MSYHQQFRRITAIPLTNTFSKASIDTRTVHRRQKNIQIVCGKFRKDTTISQNQPCRTLVQQLGEAVLGLTLSAGLLLVQVSPSLAQEKSTIRFAASGNPEIFASQKTLVETWGIIQDEYVDTNFNGTDWETELIASMTSIMKSDDGNQAYSQIGKMLEKLGDPYTRIVSPEDYADFRVSSEGELQGVGLLIATDISSGKLIVVAPIKGSPAERAGILTGDEVVSVDGMSTDGWDGERAAKSLRGVGGTSVRVKFARRTDQIPGVPGYPEQLPTVSYRELKLKREKVVLSSVVSTVVPENEHKIGYVKLNSFTNNSATDVRNAILDCEKQGADSYVLDLRNNPGGLVKSSMEIARLLMDGNPTVFNVTGRGEFPAQTVGLSEGKALLRDKLVVLVNKNSASASEILAGALQDNKRATIIGDKTFGKGKIQSVFELADGSALFVTVAKYVTPEYHQIDQVGVHPDSSCSPFLNKQSNESQNFIFQQLEEDDCFLTAENMLAADKQ